MAMIVAFDPGGTTGIATYETQSRRISTYERGPEAHHVALWEYLNGLSPDVVICESFDYRVVESKGTKMPQVNLISRNYIGVIELWCALSGVPLIMQTPAQGGGGKKHSGFWKNDKLKKLGLHNNEGGREHRNDAVRHILYWISFTRKDQHFIRLLK